MKDMLPCAILCGGLATRLRPATDNIPKSLIDINGEPFIAHQLRLLHSNGVERVMLCAGYLGEMIASFVGDGAAFGLCASYSFDGDRQLGTAGAIRKALPSLGSKFFVVYGDSYLPCDYGAIAAHFEQSAAQGLMTIYRNQDSFDASNVEASGGRILLYDKRHRTPAMQYIDYGVGVFSSFAFADIPAGEHWDLAAVYEDLLAKGQLASFEVAERFYEIGSLQGIDDLKCYLRRSGVPR